jgi:hypothetical protein
MGIASTNSLPLYLLEQRLGESQSQCGRGGEEKTLCLEPNPSRPTRSLVTILTELSQQNKHSKEEI